MFDATQCTAGFLLTWLARTTSDCVWQGLSRSSPVWPALPGYRRLAPAIFAQVAWLILICVCDDASSNRKLVSVVVTALITQREQTLCVNIKCWMHILHRCVVPMLKRHNMIGNLYRAGHVLQVGSYWSALVKRVGLHVKNTSSWSTTSNKRLLIRGLPNNCCKSLWAKGSHGRTFHRPRRHCFKKCWNALLVTGGAQLRSYSDAFANTALAVPPAATRVWRELHGPTV